MVKRHLYLGEEIEYEVLGQGPALVFLHGFLGSKRLWKPIAKRFSLSHKVFLIDLPGHGNSKSLAYVHSMEMLSDLVKSILSSHQIRKVTLVGHSMGGYVALAFAEMNTDMLKGLVLVNSSAVADSKEKKSSRDQFIKLLKSDKERALKLLVPTFFNYKAVHQKSWIRSYLKEALKCDLRGIIASVEGMKKRPEREIVLKFAPYPYLIIAGRYDAVIPTSLIKTQAGLNENGQFVELEDASHMSFIEDEASVFKQIKVFVKKL